MTFKVIEGLDYLTLEVKYFVNFFISVSNAGNGTSVLHPKIFETDFPKESYDQDNLYFICDEHHFHKFNISGNFFLRHLRLLSLFQ